MNVVADDGVVGQELYFFDEDLDGGPVLGQLTLLQEPAHVLGVSHGSPAHPHPA